MEEVTTAAPVPVPRVWNPDDPGQCCCGYVTQRRGRLIVREPAAAWSMKEFINHDRIRASLTEKTRHVFRHVYELRAQHVGDSRTSYRGTPDWHLWPAYEDQHADGADLTHVFIELKVMRTTDAHDPSDDQVQVMTELGWMSPVYLVRPCCLLSGAVDFLLCRHFGGEPRSEYADGYSADEQTQLGRQESRRTAAARSARAALGIADTLAPAARPAPVPEELPGSPGLPTHVIGPAHAVVVPQPAGNDAIREVEAWMRASGFPPAATRYPLRFVIAAGVAATEVSTGLARPGQPAPREWRWTLTRFHFPFRLAAGLGMTISDHPNIIAAATAAASRPTEGTT